MRSHARVPSELFLASVRAAIEVDDAQRLEKLLATQNIFCNNSFSLASKIYIFGKDMSETKRQIQSRIPKKNA